MLFTPLPFALLVNSLEHRPVLSLEEFKDEAEMHPLTGPGGFGLVGFGCEPRQP